MKIRFDPRALLERLRSLKIRTKAFLFMAIPPAFIFLLVVLIVPKRLEKEKFMAAEARLRQVARVAALDLAPKLAASERKSLEKAILAIKAATGELLYCSVVDNSGTTVAAYKESGFSIAASASHNGDGNEPAFDTGDICAISEPLVFQGRSLGRLDMGFGLPDLAAGERRVRGTLFLAGGTLLGVGIILAFIVSILITRPLTRMTKTVERVSKGDLKHRARVHSRDEMSLLARSFNTMVDNLEKAYRQLENLNRDLESRVENRTLELEREISDRRRMERELRLIREELERRVSKRTEQLATTNDELQDKVLATRRAEDQLQNTLERLQKALEGTVRAMSLTIEMRDLYTAGHQRRVTNLAVAIANEMNLPSEKVEGIRTAGVIHDIGKIAMPAEILAKPTRLTKTEFHLIKEHPRIGFDILKTIEFPWPVAHIVLQHHERIDGSGYPDGLVGEAILIESRILAVADIVEALSSHRPYRPAMGLDKALEEIRKGRGILYDMRVVDACLRLFKEKKYRLERNIDSTGFN